jgi:hypothetical protein
LPPRSDAVYRVRVRAQRPGQGTVLVKLTAEHERPVQSEMSVHVSGEAPATPVGNPKPPDAEGLR